MNAFEQLDPLVQHHIVNTLGWRALRPLQQACIEPILSGEHCLLLAPTAGGKTEAATFPMLSRIVSEDWKGVSVLYVCPLKALLNNLHERLEGYLGMIGRSCGLWHGDVSVGRKNHIKANPPDVLLTTPESLEAMLISTKPEGRTMLRSVRTVIVDEIHAFAGDDRGWHLLLVLERIGKLAGRELQRIGLSATVGNPNELLDWLSGHCEGGRRLIQPEANATAAVIGSEVQLDYVGSLQNAAIVISRLFRGEKRLVFCDSRSRVEELGNLLRELEITVFLSHSSLSAEERRASEEAFARAQDCVIVATSTLELGIDVGDLDRVIQIDAPWTVASFLQRIGRTGRRAGSTRNCLFLATNEDALLRAGALLELWTNGFVEPITPPDRPLHLFAQQLMALALQEGGIGLRDWRSWLGRVPCFTNESDETLDRIIDHLLSAKVMCSDGVRLSIGDSGEEMFGRRHFMELVSVITSSPTFKVRHGANEIGVVDQLTFNHRTDGKPVVLSLAGRGWEVQSLDWNRREAFVVPTDLKGKSRWRGGRAGMPYHLSRAVHSLLRSEVVAERWTQRARNTFAELRLEYDYLLGDGTAVVESAQEGTFRWYTFAGSTINTALADSVKLLGFDNVSPDDFCLRVSESTNARRVVNRIIRSGSQSVVDNFELATEFLDNLKFAVCLPEDLSGAILKGRMLSYSELDRLLAMELRFLSE